MTGVAKGSTMKSARILLLLSFALAAVWIAPALRADVTVRYKTEVKMGAGAPPAITQQTAGVMKSAVPATTVIQIKGTEGYSSNGNLTSLIDFAKQVITVVDPAHNQYATVYMKDYADQVLSAMPGRQAEAAQKALASMKSDFTSEKTGKMDTILGIQAEETKLTLIIYMPNPGAGAALTDAGAATPPELMKMIVHVWTAVPSEVENIPALHEFSSVYGDPSAESVLNPDAILGKAFGSIPGINKGFLDMMDELSRKKAIMLGTNMEMYMPFMAALKTSGAGGENDSSFDPTASVFEVNMEVEDISAAPIDDSVFEVPRDAQLVSLPDFLHALLPAAAPAPQADGHAQLEAVP